MQTHTSDIKCPQCGANLSLHMTLLKWSEREAQPSAIMRTTLDGAPPQA